MGKLYELKDEAGNVLFPITVTDAIVYNNELLTAALDRLSAAGGLTPVSEDGLYITDADMNIGYRLMEHFEDTDIEGLNTFLKNIDVREDYDEDSGTFYFVIRINKTRVDGTIQIPHVDHLPTAETLSTLDFNAVRKYSCVMGASYWGTQIEDGNILGSIDGRYNYNGESTYGANTNIFYPMIIDKNGDLNFVEPDCDVNDLIACGVQSLICGFAPIVIDYAANSDYWPSAVTHYSTQAQRQIMGQYANGDYAFIVCEGRKYSTDKVNSSGWTIPQAQKICVKLGLKFAYNFDGGGGTELVLGHKMLNHPYENTTGRTMENFIYFE